MQRREAIAALVTGISSPFLIKHQLTATTTARACNARYDVVLPGYFEAMQTRVVVLRSSWPRFGR